MKVLQVVGYKNSGKTTLVEKIIRYFTMRGVEIGSIKHHGHGGKLDGPISTDSVRHQQAGAIVSTVQGDGEIQLLSHGEEWSLEKILQLYQYLQIHTVVVEGYKAADYPKIVIIKNDADVQLVHELTNIVAIINWNETTVLEKSNCPSFIITEEEQYLKWIWKEVNRFGKNV